MKLGRWALRLGSLALASAFASLPAEAEARRVYGAEIPDRSDPVGQGEGLFVIRKPWDRALRELRRTYGRVEGIVIRRIDTPPSVKAFYVENTRRGRTWDGINIYEKVGEETVFVSVLPARRRR